jgi:hypothetical protein
MNEVFAQKTDKAMEQAININLFFCCLLKLHQLSWLDLALFLRPKDYQKEWKQIIQIVSEFTAFKNNYGLYHLQQVE